MRKDKFYFFLVLAVVALSFAVKIFYVFHLTDYRHYLFSDCGGYWSRAQERLNGGIFNESQWGVWPPFYHIVLTEIFKVIRFFGMFAWKLEIVLILQIVLCTASVYCLYRIALDVTRTHLTSFLATFTYAFSYVLIYFKAFILSENMAIPLVIFSVRCLFIPRNLFVVLSGILLALATGMRTGYGLLGLPFALYLMLGNDLLANKFKKILMFGSSFCVFIFLISAQNNYISYGRVTGLGANGGVTFYQSSTGAYKIISIYKGGHAYLGSPLRVGHPEQGTMVFKEPFFDSSFFFNQGIQYIKTHPQVWLRKIFDFKGLFFSHLFPTVFSARWFVPLLLFSRWEMLGLSLCSLMVWVVIKSRRADNAKLGVLISIPACLLVVYYFFNVEYRYFYAFAFAIHIICFATLAEIWRLLRVLMGRYSQDKEIKYKFFLSGAVISFIFTAFLLLSIFKVV